MSQLVAQHRGALGGRAKLGIDQSLQLRLLIRDQGASRLASGAPSGHELIEPLPLLRGEKTIGAQVAYDDQSIAVLAGEL